MVPASFQLRLIAPIICCVFSHTLHAQLAEWADQRSEEIHLVRALPVGSDRLAIIGTTTFAGNHLISLRNGDGTIAWENTDQFFTGSGFGDVIVLPDSGLLHVGAADGCDYISSPSRLRRYAPDGTVMWEEMIGTDWTGFVTLCAKGATDLLALASEDSVYVLDMDGNLVDGYYSPSVPIRKLHWQGDSALFVITDGSILRVDLDGNVLNSSPLGAESMDIHWDGQRVFVLAMDGIHCFDQELVQLDITPLPSLDGNSAFVVPESGLSVNTTAGLYQVGTDGSATLLFPWPELPELTPTGCAVRDGQVFSLGNTYISGRSTGLVRRLSTTGEAAQHDEDVEVLLHVDTSWTEPTFNSYWSRMADITGRVVNHGTTVLNEVVVQMWTDIPFMTCTIPGYRVVASELGLQPGDTASLPFGVVEVGVYLSASQAAGFDDICIVALAPNNLADRHTEDNTSCVSVEFVLGGNEVDDDPSILLAPNPATGTVLLSGSALTGRMVHVRLLDTVGRIVLDRNVAGSTGGLTIDVSGLPSAAYVVTTDVEGLHAMAQLIIVHP